MNVPLERFSDDNTRPNSFGVKLIEFCRRNNMYITSGRTGNDKSIGKATTTDDSLIDYFIVSADLFECISEFDVMCFDPLVSDRHKQLHINLEMENCMAHKEKENDIHINQVKWRERDKNLFIENIQMW